MKTTEEFERAIDALDAGVVIREMKLHHGKVRECIGCVANNRIVWTASGEALKGRQRVKELDLKFS